MSYLHSTTTNCYRRRLVNMQNQHETHYNLCEVFFMNKLLDECLSQLMR